MFAGIVPRIARLYRVREKLQFFANSQTDVFERIPAAISYHEHVCISRIDTFDTRLELIFDFVAASKERYPTSPPDVLARDRFVASVRAVRS